MSDLFIEINGAKVILSFRPRVYASMKYGKRVIARRNEWSFFVKLCEKEEEAVKRYNFTI